MGFKALAIGLILLSTLGSPALGMAAETPSSAEEGVGNNFEEVEKPKLTPEQEAAILQEKKLQVESTVRSTFSRLGTTDPSAYVGRIISGLMGVLGSLTLVMFVYSGLLWMTAAGDAGKSEKARDILVWSSLGLLVIFSSYAILRFVFDIFLV